MKGIVWLLFVAATSVVAVAQGVVPGSVEVSGNAGGDNQKGTDNKGHVNFGFGAAYNLSKPVTVGFDYAYQPLGTGDAGVGNGVDDYALSAKEHLQLFGGMARFSLLKNRHAVPYVVLAGGGVTLSANVTVTGYGPGAISGSSSGSQSGGYAGGGGGVSVFLTHHLGLRPEVRYERLQFHSTDIDGYYAHGNGTNEVEGTLAVFYQFGGYRRR